MKKDNTDNMNKTTSTINHSSAVKRIDESISIEDMFANIMKASAVIVDNASETEKLLVRLNESLSRCDNLKIPNTAHINQ